MFYSSIENPDLRFGRNGDIAKNFIIAIDVNQMIFFSECGSSLIENSTRKSDKFIFSKSAKIRKIFFR